MSEGKQHILESIELCQQIVQLLSKLPQTEPLTGQIKEAIDKLEALKEKVYLKTKKGINDAYLVLEAAKSLRDYLESHKDQPQDRGQEFWQELETLVNELISNVDTLEGGAKSRAVVIT